MQGYPPSTGNYLSSTGPAVGLGPEENFGSMMTNGDGGGTGGLLAADQQLEGGDWGALPPPVACSEYDQQIEGGWGGPPPPPTTTTVAPPSEYETAPPMGLPPPPMGSHSASFPTFNKPMLMRTASGRSDQPVGSAKSAGSGSEKIAPPPFGAPPSGGLGGPPRLGSGAFVPGAPPRGSGDAFSGAPGVFKPLVAPDSPTRKAAKGQVPVVQQTQPRPPKQKGNIHLLRCAIIYLL